MEVADVAGIVHMGLYAAHLRSWCARFPERILTMIHEESVAYPDNALNRLYSAIGVETAFRSRRKTERSNRGPVVAWTDEGVFVDLDSGTTRVLSPAGLDRLRELYRSDVHQLGLMLGRRLTDIWRDLAGGHRIGTLPWPGVSSPTSEGQ